MICLAVSKAGHGKGRAASFHFDEANLVGRRYWTMAFGRNRVTAVARPETWIADR
jgi:hypothetical protein